MSYWNNIKYQYVKLIYSLQYKCIWSCFLLLNKNFLNCWTQHILIKRKENATRRIIHDTNTAKIANVKSIIYNAGSEKKKKKTTDENPLNTTTFSWNKNPLARWKLTVSLRRLVVIQCECASVLEGGGGYNLFDFSFCLLHTAIPR